MTQPTHDQNRAILARGDILVVAGAGAGKTRTLVERCLRWLVAPSNPGSLDQVLMVTFTEAAAAEMRRRLREELQKLNHPSQPHLEEQLALLESAHICTLHSFCLYLVRGHSCELGLDPSLSVLADEQSRLLANETLEKLLDAHFRGETPVARAVQDLVQEQGRGWDKPTCDLVEHLHAYAQTLPNPEEWFAQQIALFQEPRPIQWEQWLAAELNAWRTTWQSQLEAQQNVYASQCLSLLTHLPDSPTRAEWAAALGELKQVRGAWPSKQARLRKPVETFFEQATFLQSLCAADQNDPLVDDWNWARPQALALLQLTRDFSHAFAEAKKEKGGLDFHDLEQFSLRLLWNAKSGCPTALAEAWRKRLRLIFVDEYQDINAAQDAIIRALGGEGPAANRFLVGDVKQSIYRFRLANPRIFLAYQEQWQAGAQASVVGSRQVISLSENFRSHEAILNFVNAVFSVIMRRELGGIEYDTAAHLRFGNVTERGALTVSKDPSQRVELHLCLPGGKSDQDALDNLSNTEREARIVAGRIREMVSVGQRVWDGGTQRPVRWSDIVILLRAPRNKVEVYIKEFFRFQIPLLATRGGFYESLEITDLLSLLKILDNPLQDWPLLAVLRSPMVGLSADELAAIRMAHRNGRFWTALTRWHKGQTKDRPGTYEKVNVFLGRFYGWRRKTRQCCVSQCLEAVLDETRYAEWLLTQDRGGQARANVERLLQLTRQFDALHGEGLYRFLRFVEAQQENEVDTEPATTTEKDAVRLMSIHQSKGLEFPVVVLPDLGKKFNFVEGAGRMILDEQFGLCPQIKSPHSRQYYPSLPFWLAQRRQRQETCGEELRLLYVALTRAIDRLILVGTTRPTAIEEKWPGIAQRGVATADLLAAGSYLDWLGPWLSAKEGGKPLPPHGQNELLTWTVHEQIAADTVLPKPVQANDVGSCPGTSLNLDELRSRLEWTYPQQEATRQFAKTSVSELRREIVRHEEEEIEYLFASASTRSSQTRGGLDASGIGSAHHSFLEWLDLEGELNLLTLQAEAQRLCREQKLTSEEVGCLDLEGVAAFWSSETGKAILSRRKHVRRELPFTMRFEASDVRLFPGAGRVMGGDDFVIVQGVIDLAVILPDEIWVLDFKTDFVSAEQLAHKVKQYQPQLGLYAQAISRIYARPVTRRWLHFLSARQTVQLEGCSSINF